MKAAVGAVLMLLVGCTELGDDNIFTALPDAEPLLQPTLASIEQNVFAGHCSCHTLDPPSADMSLRIGAAHDALVNVAVACSPTAATDRVIPGDADNSFLFQKILGKNDPGALDCADPMPPDPSLPLSQRQIDVIRTWIENGAEP